MKNNIIDKKMEYITYGNMPDAKWRFLQIKGNETLEGIANKILPTGTARRFYPEDATCVGGHELLSDDDRLFIIGEEWLEIWQIGTKLTDMYGNIIPGIISVRRIGEIL